MIRIEPLTERTLKEAIDLVNMVFPEQIEEPASVSFTASLNPKKFRNILWQYQIPELKYWVAINEAGKIVGTAGLYCYQVDEREACWLGWFCVDPATRERGTGTRLLEFSINMARKKHKRFLRLYTSTDPNELNAHRLYEKHGFRLVREEPFGDTGLKKLYYELKL